MSPLTKANKIRTLENLLTLPRNETLSQTLEVRDTTCGLQNSKIDKILPAEIHRPPSYSFTHSPRCCSEGIFADVIKVHKIS